VEAYQGFDADNSKGITMRLTAKQTAFTQYYADPGSETYNNAYQSAIKAGYAHNTARNTDSLILANIGVQEAIDEYKAELAEVLEHNREVAVQMLNNAATWAKPNAKEGNPQAIQAYLGAVRELNAISNLHSSKITTEHTPPELSPELQEQARAAARIVKLRIAGGKP
jgi:hypothetical protein